MKNLKMSGVLAFAIMLFTISTALKAQEQIDVDSFHALSVSNAFMVEMSVGKTESLKVEIEDRFRDDLIATVKDGTLVIGLKSSLKTRIITTPLKAYVTVRSLDEIKVSGAVYLQGIDVLKGNKLNLKLSGASVVQMGVEVDELSVKSSGASVVKLKGISKNQTLKISGASVYRAYNLTSKSAHMEVSGASAVKINVYEQLEAKASGASTVRYHGNPKDVRKTTSGASSVKKD